MLVLSVQLEGDERNAWTFIRMKTKRVRWIVDGIYPSRGFSSSHGSQFLKNRKDQKRKIVTKA
jgi:hypothetical protein